MALTFLTRADFDVRSLYAAIALSLLTHARASPEDDLQDPSELGGWWGDTYPDVPGDLFGSRLWTLAGRNINEALELAPDMITESLVWAVEDELIVGHELIIEIAGPGALAICVRPDLGDGKIADVLGPWYVEI